MRTLGIEALNLSVPREEYFYFGFMLSVWLVYAGLLAFVAKTCVEGVIERYKRRSATSGPWWWKPRSPRLFIRLHLTGFFVFNGLSNSVIREIRHLPLQDSPPPIVGLFFTEESGSMAWMTLLLLAAGIWAWGAYGYFVHDRIVRGSRKRIFVVWHILTCIILLLNWVVLEGAAATIENSDVVTLQNAQDLVGNVPALFLRLGSDDRDLALLAIFAESKGGRMYRKALIIVPKSEVKWIGLITRRPVSLYRYAWSRVVDGGWMEPKP